MTDLNIFFFINVTTAINYSLPIALYTQIAYSRHFSEAFVGVVFAIYSICILAMIPFTNLLITKLGRYNILVIGSIVKSLSSVFYISLAFFHNKTIFAILSIIARGLQGLSVELINIIIFSLASATANNGETGSNLSYVEMATSLGLILGPFLSFLFGFLGYIVPFAISLLLDVIAMYLLCFKLKTSVSELNRMEEDESKDGNKEISSPILKSRYHSNIDIVLNYENTNNNKDKFKCLSSSNHSEYSECDIDNIIRSNSHFVKRIEDDDQNSKVTQDNNINKASLFSLLLNKEIFLTFLVVMVDFIAQNFFTPVFTLFMREKYNINGEISSILLSLTFFIYFISLRFIGYFIDNYPSKFLLAVGLLINSFCAILMNPVSFFPQRLVISMSGFCILNAFAGFAAIGSLVDFTHSLKKLGMNEYIANDNASTIYMLGINFAELIGPIVGGVFTNMINFEFASLLVGSFNLFVSILFVLLSYDEIWRCLIKLKLKTI